jgi:hypothetical protein
MADSAVMTESPVDNLDLKQEVTSPGQKRKRDSVDQTAEDRRAKRGGAAPAANMEPSADASNLSFLEAATAEGVVGVDLSALQQANEAANHTVETAHQRPVVTDVSNATSTAAAALGSMYPTLHVPSSTEQQFVQAAASEATNVQDGTFADVSHVTQHESEHSPAASLSSGTGTGLAPNGTQPPQEQSPQPGPLPHHPQPQVPQQPQPPQQPQVTPQPQPRADYQFRKPPVGSDEWHKLRKDNHKEGSYRPRSDSPPLHVCGLGKGR